MFNSIKTLARQIIDGATEDYLADLRARRFPEVTPIPMDDWLAQLDARVKANGELAQPIPIPGEEDEGDEPGDADEDARGADWEDFDRRR